ncbi:putative metal-dependent hydrolase [Sphingobacterium olei]|uniref:Putative metal-dependent hydrolase n=1 Tax=Sphingobacterium olei TaxID=2571155 RepID=A0A4U0P2U2_9SPHI|nr:putative metal-dependent hydrolase [Sphingobacterium olei]TJZ61533.1 putative metal-dependent hydrolase [Sphingobacterium olei]
MNKDIEILKYPIGKFQIPTSITPELVEKWIETIEIFPHKLKAEVQNLTENELKKQYRPNGWTITQVVNHCADSHMNSLIRFKLALTEETPTIKPYCENLWAELSDSKHYRVDSSIIILEGLHARWTTLLKSLHHQDLEKEFIHPETQERISIKTNIGFYAWHCEHHLAHIINAKRN